MKCYYHRDTEAIALCKSCNRALCENCAVDVHPGTACINRCESDVTQLNVAIARSKLSFQKAGKSYRRNGISLLLAGIVFLFVGVLPIITRGDFGNAFIAVLGAVFLLWSFFSFLSGKQIEKAEKDI